MDMLCSDWVGERWMALREQNEVGHCRCRRGVERKLIELEMTLTLKQTRTGHYAAP